MRSSAPPFATCKVILSCISRHSGDVLRYARSLLDWEGDKTTFELVDSIVGHIVEV
jgi:hypothetical protein